MAASRGGAESTRALLMWPAHSAGSGLLRPFSGMLSLQRILQNNFHKTHPTSAQCQCAGINKKVLVNRAKLWNSITGKFSFVHILTGRMWQLLLDQLLFQTNFSSEAGCGNKRQGLFHVGSYAICRVPWKRSSKFPLMLQSVNRKSPTLLWITRLRCQGWEEFYQISESWVADSNKRLCLSWLRDRGGEIHFPVHWRKKGFRGNIQVQGLVRSFEGN